MFVNVRFWHEDSGIVFWMMASYKFWLMGTWILEACTVCIFRIEVGQARRVAGYIWGGGGYWMTRSGHLHPEGMQEDSLQGLGFPLPMAMKGVLCYIVFFPSCQRVGPFQGLWPHLWFWLASPVLCDLFGAPPPNFLYDKPLTQYG
jgi:hypothetical protein